MTISKAGQLEQMHAVCLALDADVRRSTLDGHITVLVPEGRSELAHSVQKRLMQQSALYPNIVCYCFDEFSTLIYAV